MNDAIVAENGDPKKNVEDIIVDRNDKYFVYNKNNKITHFKLFLPLSDDDSTTVNSESSLKFTISETQSSLSSSKDNLKFKINQITLNFCPYYKMVVHLIASHILMPLNSTNLLFYHVPYPQLFQVPNILAFRRMCLFSPHPPNQPLKDRNQLFLNARPHQSIYSQVSNHGRLFLFHASIL